jgi:hypothetical protein
MSQRKTSLNRIVQLSATGLALALLARPAGAVDAPKLDLPAISGTQSGGAGVVEVRYRGGGGGGGVYRGGGYRRPYYRGGLIVGPIVGYGAYSYYNDCRSVRVKERSCWRDSDGDRHCGARWVVRRVCD